jgi:hypothetical protein
MIAPMHVLVVESERRGADRAVEELEQAGHVVARCTEPLAPAFPCAALSNGACPLDAAQPIDVVLDVRRHPGSQPAPGEAGVSCALRRHVPLVVAGGSALNPFAEWATEIQSEPFDVVPACERAAQGLLAPHTRVAALAVREVLDARGFEHACVLTAVYRRGGRLDVHVRAPSDLPREAKAMVSVRIVAAVRELDRHALGIDVVFESSA